MAAASTPAAIAGPLGNAASKAASTEARLNALVTAVGALVSTLQPLLSNSSFLSALSLLPNQTTANSTISTTAGTFSNSERIAFNGLVNAVNNLQSHLQSNGFEA